MNTPSFSPEQAVVTRERSERDQEKHEAFVAVLSMLENKHKEISAMKTTLELAGKERALRAGSSVDMIAFKAQTLHHASQEVLKEVRGVDYKEEFAAAKLEELLHSYQIFVMRYAEILENDSDIAARLKNLDPNLEVLDMSSNHPPANDTSFGDNKDVKYSVG
jgi:hypothetical protein